jgi:hypothetical protein
VEGLGAPRGVDDYDSGGEEGVGDGGKGLKLGLGLERLWRAWGRDRDRVVR